MCVFQYTFHQDVLTSLGQRPNLPVVASSVIPLQDRSGRTPLHRAVAVSDYAKVRRLLDANADVTARDICGWYCLHRMER